MRLNELQRRHLLLGFRALPYLEACWKDLGDIGLFAEPTGIDQSDPMGHEYLFRGNSQAVLVLSLLLRHRSHAPRGHTVEPARWVPRIEKAILFAAATHCSNTDVPRGFRPWGHEWQSTLWTAQLLRASFYLGHRIGRRASSALKRIAASEADRFIGLTPPAGLFTDTKAEENAWDATLLAWAANVYESHRHASDWELAAKRFAMCTFSRPEDRVDHSLLEGKPISWWCNPPSAFTDRTVQNHGSFHPAYQACYGLLGSCAASYIAHGRQVPPHFVRGCAEAGEHNLRLALPDGRVVFTSGNDWDHYSPIEFSWHYLTHVRGGDDAPMWLQARALELAEKLQAHSPDGTILGGVLPSQPVRQRLWMESNNLLAFVEAVEEFPLFPVPDDAGHAVRLRTGVWRLPWAETVYARTERAFASFTWRSLRRGPLGVFLPLDGQLFCGWGFDSFTGRLSAAGKAARPETMFHRDSTSADSFATYGVARWIGAQGREIASHLLFFCFIGPADTAVLWERLVATRAIRVTENMGLCYSFDNDVANDCRRTVATQRGERTRAGLDGKPCIEKAPGRWVSIDGAVAISSDNPLLYWHDGQRNDRMRGRSFFLDTVSQDTIAHAGRCGALRPGSVIREGLYLLEAAPRPRPATRAEARVSGDAVSISVGAGRRTWRFRLQTAASGDHEMECRW